MCLGCLYVCPVKALRPGFLKFVVLDEGFSLGDIRTTAPIENAGEIRERTRGWVWRGDRRYLTGGD